MTDEARPWLQPSGSEGLLAAHGVEQLKRNGVPDGEIVAARFECHRVLMTELEDDLESLVYSPLGIGWTDIFDAQVRGPINSARLRRLGWFPLDRLGGPVRRRQGRTSNLWAVVVDGRVLGGVRVHDGKAAVTAVDTVLARCRQRKEVSLREVFELRELRRLNSTFPNSSAALTAAADIESRLGGRRLARWASGRELHAPAPLRHIRSARGLVIAVSGVDGSGKTTLRTALVTELERCGVPVSTIWIRPGMGLGVIASLAGWAKRLLRQDATPGIRFVATQPTDEVAPLRSRGGAVGWAWAMLVSSSFLIGVWRQHRAADGVIVYDRHLVDALATLDFAYAGVNLKAPHRLVRGLLPRADISLYLDVPTEVSVARKPDDLIGATAVHRQLQAYERWLRLLPPTARLDATHPPHQLLSQALQVILGEPQR